MQTGGKIKKSDNNVTVIRALSNINLEITAGQRVGIVGHNGSGKTTLLRCLSGIYVPTSGQVIREGTLSSFLEVASGLEPELSGLCKIYVECLMLRGVYNEDKLQCLLAEVEEFSELGNFLKLPVRTYSSGMMMRLIFSTVNCRNSSDNDYG